MNKNVKINNPTLVDAWRQSNPHIVQFWWAVDHAVTEAVKYKHTTTEYGLTFSCRSGILFITAFRQKPGLCEAKSYAQIATQRDFDAF